VRCHGDLFYYLRATVLYTDDPDRAQPSHGGVSSYQSASQTSSIALGASVG
jgi:hypothetical protein